MNKLVGSIYFAYTIVFMIVNLKKLFSNDWFIKNEEEQTEIIHNVLMNLIWWCIVTFVFFLGCLIWLLLSIFLEFLLYLY